MPLCEQCQTKELTGKQKRFCSDDCHDISWTDTRRKGAALGRGLDSLLPEKPKGKIHAAPVIGNPRLEPLLNALMSRKEMTSLELHRVNGSMAIHSDIAEIRARGYAVSPAEYVGRVNGRKVYRYKWEGK